MKIRKATEQDVDRIAEIYNAVHDEIEAGRYAMNWHRDLYPTRLWAEERQNAGDLYAMEDEGGAVVATAVINHNPLPEYAAGRWHQPSDYERVLVIHSLVVDPRQVRKGYATAFMRYFEEMGRATGCTRLRLDTQQIDLPARRLYRKLGYREADYVPCRFKGINDIDLVLIEKIL